jgi:MtaA/CmuA family methyltransferase
MSTLQPRNIFIKSLHRESGTRPATGSLTSVITVDLMDEVGVCFPDAHTDSEKMASLAAAGYTVLGFDNVMPLFSVWHESAALGCNVNWGAKDRMPDCRDHLCKSIEDEIQIPKNLLTHPGCNVPLKALSLLKKWHGDKVAVVGKVFGPWTLGYHVFGVQKFLMASLLNPDAVKTAMEKLKEVTIQFAIAQIESGADVLCLADHATRDLCSPQTYQNFLQEMHQELSERIPCPLVLHICGDTSDRIMFIRETGVTGFHYDSKVSTPDARRLAGEKMSLAGGTSNFDVILNGNAEIIRNDVKEKVENNIDIIGPECAVPLNAPYRNLKMLADEVKKLEK